MGFHRRGSSHHQADRDRRRRPDEDTNPGDTTRTKVLVVDDDYEIVSAIRAVLETKGYRILTASDGQAGLNMARREKPKVVIVDMMMPKKSGFVVLEQLKKDNDEPPSTIMITANEGSRHRAFAELLGVDAYLRKPFAMERLIEEVERLTT